MNKVDPNDVAKWFCKQDIIKKPNSIDGNTKLQKLMFFAQLIYMAKNEGNTMFDDEFYAFKNGFVLEPIRKQYKKNYKDYFTNAEFNFSKDVLESLNLTKNIFGDSSAQELSDLSHEFEAWKKYFIKSKTLFTYIKEKGKVPYSELREELYKINNVLDAYTTVSTFQYTNEDEDY